LVFDVSKGPFLLLSMVVIPAESLLLQADFLGFLKGSYELLVFFVFLGPRFSDIVFKELRFFFSALESLLGSLGSAVGIARFPQRTVLNVEQFMIEVGNS
jgi:hypothetical protein